MNEIVHIFLANEIFRRNIVINEIFNLKHFVGAKLGNGHHSNSWASCNFNFFCDSLLIHHCISAHIARVVNQAIFIKYTFIQILHVQIQDDENYNKKSVHL